MLALAIASRSPNEHSQLEFTNPGAMPFTRTAGARPRRELARQAGKSGLRGGIGGAAPAAAERGDRHGIDHRPARCSQGCGKRLRHPKSAHQIDAQDAIPELVRQRIEICRRNGRAGGGCARVVDEVVEAAEQLQGARGDLASTRRDAEIARHRLDGESFVPQTGHRPIERILTQVVHRDARAAARQ